MLGNISKIYPNYYKYSIYDKPGKTWSVKDYLRKQPWLWQVDIRVEEKWLRSISYTLSYNCQLYQSKTRSKSGMNRWSTDC